MSTKNKNIASQALLEMDTITAALKEESKNSISTLLSEAVKNALRESCNEEDEDDYEIQDEDGKTSDKKKKNSKKSENEVGNPNMDGNDESGNEAMNQPQTAEPEMGGVQGQGAEQVPDNGEMNAQDGNGEEGWEDFSDYQVGNSNTYDLTGENDYDTVVKVYKLLNDDDQVVIRKEGNTINLQDNNAGTEYVIDLGDEGEEPEVASEPMDGEEMPEDLNESIFEVEDDDEMAGFPEDSDEDEFGEFDVNDYLDDTEYGDYIGWENDAFVDELGGPDEDLSDEDLEDTYQPFEDEDELMEGKIRNNKKARKPMKESKEVLFEVDLGYTDNYQDKDPIAGLSNDEPSKSGKSWHKGVPTGTKKPWAGDSKSKGDPFKHTQKVQGSVNEEDMADMGANEVPMEEAMSNSTQNARHSVKTKPSNGRKNYLPNVTKKVSTAEDGYEAEKSVNESKELKTIKNENKELKKAIMELRKNLNEAYITNVNLGKITKLFLENTTSKEEKVDIVNRFSNEAKTVEQSAALYESINKQLKKNQQINLNESSTTANGTKDLNEQKIYKSNDLLKTIDLMGRVLSC